MTGRSPKTAIPLDIRVAVIETTQGHCWYCGKIVAIDHTNTFNTYEVDHIISVSRGGTNDHENLVPACRPCNQAKRYFPREQYRVSRYLRSLDIRVPAESLERLMAHLEQTYGVCLTTEAQQHIRFWGETHANEIAPYVHPDSALARLKRKADKLKEQSQ